MSSLALVLGAPHAQAQADTARVVLVMVAPAAREQLAQEWARHQRAFMAPEQGYCGMWHYYAVDLLSGPQVYTDTLPMIDSIHSPVVRTQAGVSKITFLCRTGEIRLHTHGMTDCLASPNGEQRSCKQNGVFSQLCMPSRTDLRLIPLEGAPYEGVICGERSYIFYLTARPDTSGPQHQKIFTPTNGAVIPGDTTPAVAHSSRAPALYAGVLGGALVLNWFIRLDADYCANGKRVCLTGTYPDGWKTTQPFSDKAWHGLSSFAMTELGVDVGLRPWKAAALACGAATLFEVTQGYISRYDIQADAIGCSAGLAWRTLTNHIAARRQHAQAR